MTEEFQLWEHTIKNISQNIDGCFDVIVLDWAGIGDANCHSRLIIEHLYRETRSICWLTPKKVCDLYKDDNRIKIEPSFHNSVRDVNNPLLINEIIPFIDHLTDKYFVKSKLVNISNNVCKLYAKKKLIDNYSEFFFEANNIIRDYNIIHTLIHKEVKRLNKKCVLFEYSGQTSLPINIEIINDIINKLTLKDYGVVIVGSKLDNHELFFNDNVIDIRGASLYDTFSYAKSCDIIIGRSSGNQSLGCFLPDIKIIEINVMPSASYANCKLHKNVSNYDVNYFNDNINEIII